MKTHLTLLFLTLYTCVTSLHGNHQEAVDFVESLLFDNPSTSSQEDESLFLQKCQRAPQFQEEEPVEHPQILLFISSSVPVQSWQTFSPDLET
ncbi:MAG: hypothetical protein KAR79_03520, partial [Simkaniaceae bacterium]|nr:hypothetical protein [Simkaniaceae bacterium]